MSTSKAQLTRRELYDLVWSEPMRTIAARYGLSDVGLRKICVRHRIPVPKQGHWQRVAAGKSVDRIALPATNDESEIVITITQTGARQPSDTSLLKPAIEAEAGFRPIVVSARLAAPHPVSRIVVEKLKGPLDTYGAVHCSAPEAPMVRVAPASTSRAARIIDGLLKAFEKRGFGLQPGKANNRYDGTMGVIVDGFVFPISLSERMQQRPYELTKEDQDRKRRGQYVYTPTYSYSPTGELTLKLDAMYGTDARSTWTDTQRKPLEERLDEVMLELRKAAIQRRMKQDQQRQQEDRLRLELERRAALRREVEAERARIDALEADAAAWKRAELIREFANVRAASCLSSSSEEQAEGLQWANDQADRIDPLKPSPPSILDTPEADMKPISIWALPASKA